jgi:nitroreductase
MDQPTQPMGGESPEASRLDMPLREAMATQRAIRRLKSDPVDDDVLLRCIELALKAPTGSNSQNWEWVVVRDPVVKAKLARLNRIPWAVYGRAGRIAKRDDPKMLRILDAVQWQADHYEEIPVLVVPCLRGLRLNLLPFAATAWYGSIYPAVQNFLLAWGGGGGGGGGGPA